MGVSSDQNKLYPLQNAFDSWKDEGYGGGLNHYTQCVWKATTHIGCARLNCPRIAHSSLGDNWNSQTMVVS